MTEDLEAARQQIRQLDGALTDLARRVAALQIDMSGVKGTIEDQADVLRSVDGLKDTVDALITRFNAIFPPDDPNAKFYAPIPTPRFWLLEGREREKAIQRLRDWADETYPVLGQFHRKLPACWDRHDLCLTAMDVLSELHSCLYLQPARNQGLLSGQAELLTRLLPALSELMAAEARGCEHQQSAMFSRMNGAAR